MKMLVTIIMLITPEMIAGIGPLDLTYEFFLLRRQKKAGGIRSDSDRVTFFVVVNTDRSGPQHTNQRSIRRGGGACRLRHG